MGHDGSWCDSAPISIGVVRKDQFLAETLANQKGLLPRAREETRYSSKTEERYRSRKRSSPRSEALGSVGMIGGRGGNGGPPASADGSPRGTEGPPVGRAVQGVAGRCSRLRGCLKSAPRLGVPGREPGGRQTRSPGRQPWGEGVKSLESPARGGRNPGHTLRKRSLPPLRGS